MTSTAKKVYYCECCGYNSKLKKDFNKHLVTKKHNINIENSVDLVTDETEKSDDEQEETSLRDPRYQRDQREQRVHHQDVPVSVKKRYECTGCSKVYKDYSGLWKHNRKSCIKPANNGAKISSASNTMVNTDLLNKIMEQNQELQKQVFELSKNSNTTNSHNTNSHNTTNNNQFNLNFFLNETCKDAININDFIRSIQLQLEDLEQTARLGYVEGVSRILINALRVMDVEKRPIHCTDIKRETVYVKNQDNWEKDNPDKNNLKRAVDYIAEKNMRQIDDWKVQNPNWEDYNSQESQVLNKIYISALGGGTPDEDVKFMNKIIKNVLQEVVVDKDNPTSTTTTATTA